MCEDIIREYPHLFEITKHVSVYLEQMISLPIPDSEVAYLALHFGAFMKPAEDVQNHLRILIVCTNGVSTGNMLRYELNNLLPNAEIVGGVTEELFDMMKKYVDISQYDSLRKDINQYIEHTRGALGGFSGRRDCGIVDILDTSRVCIVEE